MIAINADFCSTDKVTWRVNNLPNIECDATPSQAAPNNLVEAIYAPGWRNGQQK